jgi:hypothetical protein
MRNYICHFRRKDGEYDMEVDVYQGDMPRAGEIVTLVVQGETTKGRVELVTVPQHKPGGDPIVHIYVEEI